ncbi:MAG: LysR family transcriptional regulator [Candidatus Puniceispirillum sp.]|nr:LysR family transcriptional regulator [Candidatus Puniceispirillum sp.]MBL6775526.1 LysR family transcriptional regulator [Candidatus Puniceispirillum sp.]
MNFRQLKAFNAVMQTGSITGAAKQMLVSQPSVTRLIRDLELNLGFTLFVRQGRGIIATVEARRFHLAVESTFLNIERLDDLAASIRKKAVGRISIGVIPTFSTSLLPKVLGQMRRQDDATHSIIYTHNTPAIVDAIRLQQFDLGIVSRSPPYVGVDILYQTMVNYVTLIPEDHVLANSGGPIDLRDVAGHVEFVTFGSVYPLEMQGMDASLAEKFQSNARYSVANVLAGAALVREAGVPAIVDPFSARMSVASGGVVIRPIVQNMKYHIAIITRGIDMMTQETRQLADTIITAFKTDPIIASVP